MKQLIDFFDDFMTFKVFNLVVIMPLFIGSLIYLLFREDTLVIFQLLKFIGVYDYLSYIRGYTLPLVQFIPHWVLFSLPDGLWSYSLNTFCLFYCGYYITHKNVIFPIIGIFLGIGNEIMQYFHLIIGSFDMVDLFFCTLGVILAIITYVIYKKIYLIKWRRSYAKQL